MSESSTQPVSASEKAARPFDIVLYGATGFTGGLVADYLLRNLPEGQQKALIGLLDALRGGDTPSC